MQQKRLSKLYIFTKHPGHGPYQAIRLVRRIEKRRAQPQGSGFQRPRRPVGQRRTVEPRPQSNSPPGQIFPHLLAIPSLRYKGYNAGLMPKLPVPEYPHPRQPLQPLGSPLRHPTLPGGDGVHSLPPHADGYFGYPITPQSEVLETLAELKPWETTGMVVLQAESEVAAINMVYGGAGSGKMVLTSSSSPGVSLKQEGISYLAGAELPCLIVNVMRGGPGLGTIQPSQADYFQTVKGGGHGDYRLITLAPASVQEMADFVGLAFDLAFKYRNPAIILADGVIGQMMEKVVLPPQKPRRTDAEVIEQCPWATTGRVNGRKPNIITSLELKPEEMEKNNIRFQVSIPKK